MLPVAFVFKKLCSKHKLICSFLNVTLGRWTVGCFGYVNKISCCGHQQKLSSGVVELCYWVVASNKLDVWYCEVLVFLSFPWQGVL